MTFQAQNTRPQSQDRVSTKIGAVSPLSEVNCVIVKFSVRDRLLVPRGIEEKRRADDQTVDMRHQMAAFNAPFDHTGLTTVGRHRPGRVDTGEPVIQNPKLSHAAMLRRGLVNNDYRLVRAFYEVRGSERTHDAKYVISLVFAPFEGQQPLELPEKINVALRMLAAMAWQHLTVWDNPNGVVTVNFAGFQKGVKARNAIVTRGGRISVEEVEDFLPEEAE
jgi:hypothetical protein